MATRPNAVTPGRAAQMRNGGTVPTVPLARSGRPLSSGRVYGFEHNTRLRGPQQLMKAYRIAERTPGVTSGWGCLSGLATSATWDVEAADNTPLAESCAEHVRVNLGIGGRRSPLGRSWERLLGEFLAPQLRGFGWWETIAEDHIDPATGKVTRYTSIAWCDPASVHSWIVDDRERLVGIRQQADWLAGVAEVPLSQVLYLARGAEGSNFEGLGMLRAIEPWTRDQTATVQAMMAAVQRWALGTPEAILNHDIWKQAHPGKTDADFEAEGCLWDGILHEYMSYERNYIRHGNWVTLQQMGGMTADSAAGFEGIINLQQRIILTAFLAQFLMLGAAGSGGSYSLGQTHADVAQQAAENMLEAVRDDLNTALIPRMVRWQFGDAVADDMLPRLTFSGLRDPLWVTLLDKLPALFSGLSLTPQTAIESEVLGALGFKAPAIDRTPAERLRNIQARPGFASGASVAIRTGAAA